MIYIIFGIIGLGCVAFVAPTVLAGVALLIMSRYMND